MGMTLDSPLLPSTNSSRNNNNNTTMTMMLTGSKNHHEKDDVESAEEKTPNNNNNKTMENPASPQKPQRQQDTSSSSSSSSSSRHAARGRRRRRYCGGLEFWLLLAIVPLFLTLRSLTQNSNGADNNNLVVNIVAIVNQQQQQQQQQLRSLSSPSSLRPGRPTADGAPEQSAAAGSATTRQQQQQAAPLVCVIVTSYNVADYIGHALNSLLHQTYPNLYIVIVDDGSTDGTTDRAMEMLRQRNSTTTITTQTITQTTTVVDLVRLPHNTLGGTGQPSNIGLQACGQHPAVEFVMFQDGDDYMEPHAIQTMVNRSEGVEVVLADFDLVTTEQVQVETSDSNHSPHQHQQHRVVSTSPSYDKDHWKHLPTHAAFNAQTHPKALLVSPVPWRKLYRRELLMREEIQFPEGDYFYEDNAFHWDVMLQARAVAKVDQVFFHHRRERKGQTTSNLQLYVDESMMNGTNPTTSMTLVKQVTAASRLGGMFPNMISAGRSIFSVATSRAESRDKVMRFLEKITKAFLTKLRVTRWIAKKQTSGAMKAKVERRLDQIGTYWMSARDKAGSEKKVDLSIIMATYNLGEMVSSLLTHMFASLDDADFSYEVLVVDDCSTDGTTTQRLLEIAAENRPNFYLLSTPSTSGAGRARNVALPLVEGRYVYFADADDAFDFDALKNAVKHASASNIDLLLLPYVIEHVKSQNNSTRVGMMGGDEQIWNRVRKRESRMNQEALKKKALGLINYPWKQLTSSRLLMDADVFFGPTDVHNDVQFHWTSIAAARNIGFYHEKPVCVHRKFDAKVRTQITQIEGKNRMHVFSAIDLTQRALALNRAFSDDEEGASANQRPPKINIVLDQWRIFVKHLLDWAKDRVAEDMMPEFERRQEKVLGRLFSKDAKVNEDPWPYWEKSTISSRDSITVSR